LDESSFNIILAAEDKDMKERFGDDGKGYIYKDIYIWRPDILLKIFICNTILLGLVTVNVAHWEGKLLLLTPTIALADLALSFLLATLATGAGILISLRSKTVQEAQQTLTVVLIFPPMVLGMIMTLLQDRVREFVGAFKGEQILLIIIAILAVIDVVVFVAAMTRFQRSRMYLD